MLIFVQPFLITKCYVFLSFWRLLISEFISSPGPRIYRETLKSGYILSLSLLRRCQNFTSAQPTPWNSAMLENEVLFTS
jgi:hypothetical protein